MLIEFCRGLLQRFRLVNERYTLRILSICIFETLGLYRAVVQQPKFCVF
jgi:hypothetical protein